MCPHTQVYMCPHTAAYAFSPKLHMCPHAQIFMCLHTPASYYYICVLILLYMCPDATVYVLILLYMCPHTTTNVSAHSCLILPTPTASRPTSSSRSCLLFFLVSVFFWQLVAQLTALLALAARQPHVAALEGRRARTTGWDDGLKNQPNSEPAHQHC
jgi:hypothetical protein